MSQKLPHLYLRNIPGHVQKFDKSRGIEKNELEDKDPESYRRHKEKLDASYSKLIQDKEARRENKTLDLATIEIVEIKFLIPFSDGVLFDTKTRFLAQFGLSAVLQKDFNRTVLFAVENQDKFKIFDQLLNQYINSSHQENPKDTPYAITTTIYDIKYHTAGDIKNYCSTNVIFELINSTTQIIHQYDQQKQLLIRKLEELKDQGTLIDFKFDLYNAKVLQLNGIEEVALDTLVNNFDILAQAHSLRSTVVRPDQYNFQELSWGFNVTPADRNTIIGIIDNGVRKIDPLRSVIVDDQLDITPTRNGHHAVHTHGTVVASLASVGEAFFSGQRELRADAKIFSIKILESMDGYIDVLNVVEAIREAHLKHGIRLFNLSVCTKGKQYNESPSHFAYLLDKLTYELDILIFIAAGNMPYDDINSLQATPSKRHDYPYHFYNPPEDYTEYHNCVHTNICTPAESMNNITVGALAENYRADTEPHLSWDKNLPAYYSRKNHYDFKQPINGGLLSINHSNKNLFKPDIVMPGGDLLDSSSGMQVVGFGDVGTDFYAFDSGTSLAAPLAANLAAKLLNIYPDLVLQSVKALLINSAESNSSSYLDKMIEERKDILAQDIFRKDFNKLFRGEKASISKAVISAKDLHQNLSGYGKPNVERLLYSKNDTVSVLIEDIIQPDQHKVILLHIPEYLLEGDGSQRLAIKATLCFKANPVWGNHVDYNPLHISFNFVNSIVKDSLDELADILADRDHVHYERYWTDEMLELQRRKNNRELSEEQNKEFNRLKGEVRKKEAGVKSTIQEWSEDFFPLVNKPLSNRQQHSITMSKDDIKKIGNKLAIVIRCAVKENLPVDLKEWARITKEHPFSLTLFIEDKSKIEGANLYDNLQAYNQTEVVTNNLADLDQELEAEA
jgi:hypothetical protein